MVTRSAITATTGLPECEKGLRQGAAGQRVRGSTVRRGQRRCQCESHILVNLEALVDMKDFERSELSYWPAVGRRGRGEAVPYSEALDSEVPHSGPTPGAP